MKTVNCGRCTAKVDMPEGLVIRKCMSPLNEKNTFITASHELAVDGTTDVGAQILDHYDRRPRHKKRK